MSITQNHQSPFAKLHGLPWTDVQWKSESPEQNFWGGRFDIVRTQTIPTMGELMIHEDRPRYIGNLEVAAGRVEGRHRGPKWNDGDYFKWLEAAAAMYGITKDPQLDRLMDEQIELIAAAQRADGYLHTDVQIRQAAGDETAREFGEPLDFEMYNMGHLIAAAIVHHLATGKDNLLNLALKSADFLDGVFANPTPSQARHGICPTHLMSLTELYRLTDEKKYLDLAVRLLDMRDKVEKGDDDNQDRVPFRQQTTAHGHAVRGTYLWSGAADIYSETGDPTLLEPLEKIWHDLVERKLYITGGCGALFDGASPDGAVDQTKITRIHQAFGREYQLPHSTAHNETCAALGNLFFNWRMLLITGEARFADLVEHTLINSVLAGISLDGTSYFYTNTLRQLDPMPSELRWNRRREKKINCFCCPPNVARTIAELGGYAYSLSERGLHVVLYGSNDLTTDLPGKKSLTLKQRSGYPFDGAIRLEIVDAPGVEFSIHLRIPSWASDATIVLNGKRGSKPESGSFFEIRRVWKAGDVIELNLPMPTQLIAANPYVEEARNQIALMRGPVVYCLESTGLPSDVKLLDVSVPVDAKFTAVRSDELGVGVLRAEVEVAEREEWGGELYRAVNTAATLRKESATFVPYFAWDNSGESEMTVWLPLAR